jgi:hypothetical protein
MFNLLSRAARVADRISVLQRRKNVSPINLLRLKALRLVISKQLLKAGASFSPPSASSRHSNA